MQFCVKKISLWIHTMINLVGKHIHRSEINQLLPKIVQPVAPAVTSISFTREGNSERETFREIEK